MLNQARGNIVILTGAGISKESGISTFREPTGIWAKVNVNDVATPQAFAKNPVKVHEFYNARHERLLSGNVLPNSAHFALARLEAQWNASVLVITQNVDNLHEKAGTRNILHMHGELTKARCTTCGIVLIWRKALSRNDICGSCTSTGSLRPHVVWFGENPLNMHKIQTALKDAAVFVSIGTSGHVYPAASFISQLKSQKEVMTVELNLEPSANAPLFEYSTYGEATKIVPAFVHGLLESQ